MRILHLIKTSEGGAWARRHMGHLIEMGDEIHVAVPGPGKEVANYEKLGVEVHFAPVDFRIKMLPKLPGQAKAFRKLVEEVQPDIVHSHTVASTLVMRLGMRGSPIPRIFQVPGPLHLEHTLYRKGELSLAGPTDHWIATCKWTYDKYLASGVPKERLFMNYYGLDTSLYPTTRTGRFREQLGIAEDTPLAGMVAYVYAPKKWLGHSRGIKGHEDFIDAFAIAQKEIRNLKGVIVGGPALRAEAYFEQVKQYARDRVGDAIIFTGTRHDIWEMYPDMDVALHPALSENLGGSVESLLCEVPTITTNIGGFPDAVIPGRTGWLVPPRAPESLAKAIVESLKDRANAKALAVAGRKLMIEMFELETTARGLHDIYRKIKPDKAP